jgi:hypothetical protein
MLHLKAKVRRGRLKLDEPYDAPDGTEVDLAVIDDGDSLDAADRKRLHRALAKGHEQIARGEVVESKKVLSKLRARRG